MCCDSMPTRGEHRVILQCYSHNFSLKNVKKNPKQKQWLHLENTAVSTSKRDFVYFSKKRMLMKINQWIFLVAFFFLHAEKCNLFNDRFFFWQKVLLFFFLTKTHFFCKSIQASCLCSNIYCNQFFTRTSYFFSLFSFGSSLKIPQIPVLSNIFSSSEMLLLRKLFILLGFF